MKSEQPRTVPRSAIVIPVKDSGEIIAEPPSIRRMLEMFEPSMFPRASWPRPFIAATTQVASSGIDVPAAITVIAMNLSDTPNNRAISVAEFTKRRPPKINPARPPVIIRIEIAIECCLIGSSSSSAESERNDDQRYHTNMPSRIAPSIRLN